MTIETGFIIAFIVACVLLAAYVYYQKWKRDNLWKSFPTWWTMKGEAPPMTGVALDVIKGATPGMKYYGSIEWVKGPFRNGPDTRLLAGVVDSFYPPTIKLMYAEKVEETALAHEIAHVWRSQTGQPATEPYLDPVFAAWLADLNAKIAKAVGR